MNKTDKASVSSNVAEASRARRHVKQTAREALNVAGARRAGPSQSKTYVKSTRTNWYAPTLWAMIADVASSPAFRTHMSQTEIIRELQKHSRQFDHFPPQVLGRMIEEGPDGKRRFTAETMRKVAEHAKYAPAKSTRRGILVSAFPRSARFCHAYVLR